MLALLRTLAAVVASLLLVAAYPAPASATDWNINVLVQKETDKDAHSIVVQGPDNMHGLRSTLTNIQDRTAGVYFVKFKGVRCADRPNVTCLRVHIKNYGSGKFPDPDAGPCPSYASACAQQGGTDPHMWVNTYQGKPDRPLMCHEVMHNLGHGHHEHPGCVGVDWRNNPSYRELRSLANASPWLTFPVD